ncbi:AAA family ATPase [Rhizobium sp. P40RR-XXII]|uniref:AAA family ATPase n=1 Tax=unclassified Rhizobium TaxID=2613769 RepID=UPI00145734DE|nr:MULTISPECIES: AAA family ATPase [unclassified Rhizobium]NLR89162.1 AAA family ATPase [Rhizobium sp. P28RR-XV]NLS21020.1 AAA family ATPase [Rhizobium sp. P40RR-XXII]
MLVPEGIPYSSEANALQERRQVTVLFADIVNYTGIALHLDPEDLQIVLQQYYMLAKAAVEAVDGLVAEHLADGIVAHFGIPTAFPDAADRAAEAAREIVEKAKKIIVAGNSLSIRVGLATGLVVAEFDGINSKIIGSSGVLAARLQACAPPGSVYMSSLTHRLLRRQQGARFIGNLSLKGFPEPEPVWVLDIENATPLVGESFAFFGRDAELARLDAIWQTVRRSGHASALCILAGRPGIGKSRILREHNLRCQSEQKRIILQGSERQTDTVFYPIIEWIKLDDRVSLDAQDTDYLRALCESETAATLQLREAPGTIRQRTFDALSAAFRAIAKRAPIQIVVEDLQWLDHSTLQLIGKLLEDLNDCPVQWLASSRPEFASDLRDLEASVLMVGELSDVDCHAAVRQCCGKEIAIALASEIVSRSEGVPLYLEHLLRELNEGRISDRGTVPETLIGALIAWIDASGPARRVAQGASVIGRRFDETMLAQVLDLDQNVVNDDIARLCSFEIFQRDDAASISFRHDLIREAAYGTLLRKRRTSLHRRVAEIFERGDPHDGDKVMAEIAYHREAGGDYSIAAGYRHRAGRYATAVGAFAEGENQLREAVRLLGLSTRAGEHVSRRQANVLADLAANLMQTRGFTDPEVLNTYEDSLMHLRKTDRFDGDSLAIFWGIFTYQILIGQTKAAAVTVSRMKAELHRMPADTRLPEHQLAVLGTRNGIQFYSGRFHDQLSTMDRIKALYEFDRHAPLAAKYGMDLLATAQAFSPHSAAITGQFQLTRELVAEADAHQVMLDIPLMLPFIHIWGGVALAYIGDFDLAMTRIQKGIALADRQGASFWSATGRMWRTITEFEATGDTSCRARMEQALAVQKHIGVGIGIPYWSAKLAAVYALDGDDRRAQECVGEAMRGSAGTSEGAWRAERQRLAGLVHERAGRSAKALSLYQFATRTAGRQSAHLWEMRARAAIARINPVDEVNNERLKLLAGIVPFHGYGND